MSTRRVAPQAPAASYPVLFGLPVRDGEVLTGTLVGNVIGAIGIATRSCGSGPWTETGAGRARLQPCPPTLAIEQVLVRSPDPLVQVRTGDRPVGSPG